ncbi:HPr-rel-A system PqqD family peptide chaperone [uncultured Sphingomonas sp.]|uniref:HPr-rel-A system PqqD family peptide chaperone n=1 Tax=uncultured Sphingomonas sp. TaxID=158754 RepID=UPI0035CACFB6
MIRYRAAAPTALVAAPLPPFTAVYHRASGTTHLLVEPAPEILAALGEAALTRAELAARLRADFELPVDAEGALAARLAELVEAGLVASA